MAPAADRPPAAPRRVDVIVAAGSRVSPQHGSSCEQDGRSPCSRSPTTTASPRSAGSTRSGEGSATRFTWHNRYRPAFGALGRHIDALQQRELRAMMRRSMLRLSEIVVRESSGGAA